jgi:hypothetical protein
LFGATGRRKYMLISEVVYETAGGSFEWIELPKGASASTSRMPPWTTPGDDVNQGVAGISKTEWPSLNSTGTRPVRCDIGGRGPPRSRKRRIC